MSGRFVELEPGRYTLAVSDGEGPAGVHRTRGDGVFLGVNGGRADFRVDRSERVYYWWRGPDPRPGVRLLGLTSGRAAAPTTVMKPEPWPTGTAG